jgi:hypothetical protein
MTSFATDKTLMRTAGILDDMTIPEILNEIQLTTAHGDTESGEVKAVLRDLRESAAILSRIVDRIRCEYDLQN